MVAYSFNKQFALPIITGRKQQTIRKPRPRHARPGETLQLYQGMRTKHCALIGTARCFQTMAIKIQLEANKVITTSPNDGSLDTWASSKALDQFAQSDGFRDWQDMKAFWHKTHPGLAVFEGVLIRWEQFTEAQP
ncbi:hypothetical protein [Ferrovibrio terrae]|uniref:hypothetical protein n=1 Tax=Ferrovibrio terrae TaxID=2594003 RepID=UPI0031377C20